MTPAQWARRLGPAALLVALAAGLIGSGLWRRLSLASLEAHHAALTAAVAHDRVLALAIYVAAFVAVVAACTPGPGLMSLAGGYLFGPLAGGAAALASCAIGSAVVFIACRTAFGDWAQRRAGPRIAGLEAAFTANAFSALLSLRLMPILPYFAVTIAAGLARVRLATLVAATLLGSAPVVFILAAIGAGLGRLFDRGLPVDRHLLMHPRILVPLALLALLSAAPIAWRVIRRPAAAR